MGGRRCVPSGGRGQEVRRLVFQVSQSREGVASVIHQRVRVEESQVGGAGSPGLSGAVWGHVGYGKQAGRDGTCRETKNRKKNKI